ncbi:hypothetical protein BCR42DRAFT_387082 [Absidia repens]|uniref:Uncharacterized protein n=1 Tax=Absidia repens TaxID=90262 RepID=A0A1X2IY83_9FUNG|nr:hypothetical protein BCR42DRAFT_387082 [Absidia repens]
MSWLKIGKSAVYLWIVMWKRGKSGKVIAKTVANDIWVNWYTMVQYKLCIIVVVIVFTWGGTFLNTTHPKFNVQYSDNSSNYGMVYLVYCTRHARCAQCSHIICL